MRLCVSIPKWLLLVVAAAVAAVVALAGPWVLRRWQATSSEVSPTRRRDRIAPLP